MALDPINLQHGLQILAGTQGRKRGHEFETLLTNLINTYSPPLNFNLNENVFRGLPHLALIKKGLDCIGWDSFERVEAIALGSLATAEQGKKWLEIHGVKVRACKSDILLSYYASDKIQTVGVSVKQCNNKTPTNAQLYFTTAQAFIRLLTNNGIPVTNNGLTALKQFCGDEGYRPLDYPEIMQTRRIDPRRFFWEEIYALGRIELENIFLNKQDEVTKLLLQKAYLDDPFSPEILIHKTKKIEYGDQEYALYSIDELIRLSKNYGSFHIRDYSVRKGQYVDPPGVTHQAPRFGIVQMQRGGQKQHPTQLQFNLQAGYFYKI